MAAPTRNLFGTATTGATNSDTLTVTMTTAASGSQVNDYIAVFVASDGSQTQSISSGAGWVKEGQINESGGACCLAMYSFKVTVAGTIPNLVVDMGATTEMAVAHWFRIRPSSSAQVVILNGAPATAQGSSTNPNPPSITNNSGVTRDIYNLAVWGGDGNNVLSTAAPTNYANHQSTGIANTNGCAIGSADRTRTGVTNGTAEDPATFTRVTEQWAAMTVGFWEVSVHALTSQTVQTTSPAITSSVLAEIHSLVSQTMETSALAIAAATANEIVVLTSLALEMTSPVIASATVGSGSAVLWTLANLATLPTHWHDFADLSTMFQDTLQTQPVTASGQQVRKLLDKGSSARHATNSTGITYIDPGNVNGRPCLRNNNESDCLSFTHDFGALTNLQFLNASTTLGVDITGLGSVSSGAVFGTSLMSPHVLEIRWEGGTGTGKVGFYLNSATTPIAESTGLTFTGSGHYFVVADCVTGGSQLNFPNNGRYFRAQSTTASIMNQNDALRPFDGDWDEDAYFKYTLTNSELEHVQGYLHHKAGIALPSGHTFENSPPYVSGGADSLTSLPLATTAPALAQATLAHIHVLATTALETSAPVILSVTIGQLHGLTSQAVTTSAPAIVQATAAHIHVLTSQTLATSAVSLGLASLGQLHALASQAVVTTSPAITSSSIGQLHALTAQTLSTAAPVLTAAVIAQTHALASQAVVTAAPSIAQASMAGTNALTSQHIATSAPAITTAALAHIHVLASQVMTTAAPVIASVTIGQLHALSSQAIATSAAALGLASLVHKHVLSSQALATSSVSLGTASLGQRHALTSQNLTTSAVEISLATLVRIVGLTSQNLATSAPAITTAALTQAHVLASQNLATSAPAIGLSLLGQKHVLLSQTLVTFAPVISSSSLDFAAGTDNLVSLPLATSAPQLVLASLGQIYGLTALNLSTASPAISLTTLGHRYALVAQTVQTGSPQIVLANIGQRHGLTAVSLETSAPQILLSSIGQNHILASVPISTGGVVLSQATMGQPITERVSLVMY